MTAEKIKNDAPASDLSLPRPSFREAISRAERQVEYEVICYDCPSDGALAHELCAIIAEVYMMNPAGPIRISGEWLDGYVVQQVFAELTYNHVCTVIEEFKRLTIDVRNKKAYLRTSLYNSVFTMNAHYTNRINYDLARG